jgi:hypothetical protein
MPTVADVESEIDIAFGPLLEPIGFMKHGRRRWVRSQKLPIRELFEIGASRCGRYSPVWGFSSGFVPFFDGHRFRCRNTDKNADMDLVIDPIDITATVPPQAFSFMPGCDPQVPVRSIRDCAAHFVPLAIVDFSRVQTPHDFCRFFLERSRLRYRRIQFHMYAQHKLAFGFVLIMVGRREEGIEKIREFCQEVDLPFSSRNIAQCFRYVESYRPTGCARSDY